MGLEKVVPELSEQLEASYRGEVTKIPNPLGERMSKVFNLLPSRYTLIGGSTGSGKTSLTDFMYVLNPFHHIRGANLKDNTNIHWEVNYFSLERKQMFKHAKWISWFLYVDYGYKIPADRILGWEGEPLTKDLYNIIQGYWELIEELLEHVTIYDGKVGIDVIEDLVRDRALALGDFYHTNSEGLFKNDNPVPIKTFDEDGRIVTTKVGEHIVLEYDHKGKTYSLKKHTHKYFLHNPKTFVYFIIDGIGLLGGSKFSDKKSSIDRVSEILSDARDKFGFSPVIVSQFNRSIGDTARHKHHGNDLSPQLEDFQGSSQTSHDADLILAIFDPYRYKAYDKTGAYGDYSITQGMMSPQGFCRFRSVHVLKNSFGMDGKQFGMLFVGESNHFQVLPTHGTPELSEIYSKIASNEI
jgi:hypothetical protein